VGDQVRIKGKLINVYAKLVGNRSEFDSEWLKWNTSITRTDTGAGACEVIYVEDVQILRKANSISYYLYNLSSWSLLLLLGWKALRLIFTVIKTLLNSA